VFKRVLSGAFGAFVIGILAPVLYLLLVGVPGSLMAFIWIALLGLVTGAIFGVTFPKLFGFIFEIFLDI
jgi:hypothetical protein